MAEENLYWGAPKIHGELLKLGFNVSERTVARYLQRIRRRGDPSKRWLTFLRNHREAILALDFFTVPTVTFKLLYGFFAIEHGRRKIVHINTTCHPTAEWVVQQLRETFPETGQYRYVILDRDSKFGADVITFLKATGVKPTRTGIRSPWQNGTAERWVGSCRRELLDHVIPLNEEHLRRLIRELNYYHEDRIHDSLGKDTPYRSGSRNEAFSPGDADLKPAPRWFASPLPLARSGIRSSRGPTVCSTIGHCGYRN
jgi:transposase InsO family protein